MTSPPTPEQIAHDALTELGETPGPDPIAQLRAVANQAMRAAAGINPPDLLRTGPLDDQALAKAREYERILDRATDAITAVARIDQTQRPRDFIEAAARAFETGDTDPVHPGEPQ